MQQGVASKTSHGAHQRSYLVKRLRSWSKILITRATSPPIFFSFCSTFDSLSSRKFSRSCARVLLSRLQIPISQITSITSRAIVPFLSLCSQPPFPSPVAERRKRRNKAEIGGKKSTREKRGDKEGDGTKEEPWKKRNFHSRRERREKEEGKKGGRAGWRGTKRQRYERRDRKSVV